MNTFKSYLEETTHSVDNWSIIVSENKMLSAGVDLCGRIEQLEPNAEALIVGGVVRDIIMGNDIHDVDIATNVSMDKIENNFKTIDIGKNKIFGILIVQYKEFNFEVAHYRSEFGTSDSRHPDVITPVSTFEADTARRDFTINSLGITKDGQIVDFQGGFGDLKEKIIRAVGIPQERFMEDALRILRACRFASKLGFQIEPNTKQAMKDLSHLVDTLSKERVQEELVKSATNGIALAEYIVYLDEIGVLERILPEIVALKGKHQAPIHHPEGDAYVHTLSALKHSRSNNPITNLAVLFHDVGKGVTHVVRDGKDTFYGHENVGARMVKDIGTRLKFSNDMIDAISFATAKHMIIHKIKELKKSKLIELVNSPYWTIAKDVAYADEAGRLSAGNINEFNTKIENAEAVAQEVSAGGGAEGTKLRLKELIDGTKLLEWIPQLNQPMNRKFIGQVLKTVQDWIINNNQFEATQDQIKQIARDTFVTIQDQKV